MARTSPDGGLQRDRPRLELVARGREPRLVRHLGRPVDPGSVQRTGLRQRSDRWRHRRAGDRRLLERRDRRQAVGAHLQRDQHHRAVQPGRLGQRDRRPGDRLSLRDEHRRAPERVRPRRRHRVELAAGRGPGPSFGLRRAYIKPDHRRRPAAAERHRRDLGHARWPATSSVCRVRQADRPGALDLDTGRHRRRHEYAVGRGGRCGQRPTLVDRRQRRRSHLRAQGPYRREGLGFPSEQTRHQRLPDPRGRYGLRRPQRRKHRREYDGAAGGDRRDRHRRGDHNTRAVATQRDRVRVLVAAGA